MNSSSCFPGKRCEWIDAAKGIAILLVLIGHSEFWAYYKSVPPNVLLSTFGSILGLCGASYMPLFYFLSGYTYKPHDRELQYRFKRLIPPYARWGFLYLIIFWFGVFSDNGSLLSWLMPLFGLAYSRYSLYPADSIQNTSGILPSGAEPLWFLTSLFTSYILFLLLLKTDKRRHITVILYAAMGYLLSFCPILLPWSLDTAFAGALFIYTGHIVKKKGITTLAYPGLLDIFLFSLSLYLFAYTINGGVNFSIREYGRHDHLSPFLFLLIGILGSLLYCFVCMALEKTKMTKPLAYIGRISLTLLCSHMLCYQMTLHIFGTDSEHPLNIQYIVLLQISTAILLSVIIHELHKLYRSFSSRRHVHTNTDNA